MFTKESIQAAMEGRKEWEEGILKKSLKRFGIEKSPNEFYTPLDIKDFDFMEKVGFPGEYPFTAGSYPTGIPGIAPSMGSGFQDTGPGLVRAGQYSGYGTAENTRDYYKEMLALGQKGGPNLAFSLPTQCGYDSDNPMVAGDVGKTGVAVDTLRDMEVIYEAFTGDMDLDKIASNWTINATANMLLAMYIALAEKRGIPQDKLRGTPQNDILKEFLGRGTYIFPPKPSMRMVRDTMVYCTKNIPHMNFISCATGHLRGAGCSREQSVGFLMANAAAYIQEGINAGLDVDSFMSQFSFGGPGGGMEMLREVAASRAARRMFAKMMKERFHAKNPRSMIMKTLALARVSESDYTKQRTLNNLCRSIIGGIGAAFVGNSAITGMGFPYDEPLGLGHSMEAWQLHRDAARIIQFEANLTEVLDPLAGSYYIESLTDQIEEEAWKIYDAIESMGGAVEAIENGWMQKEMTRSAYETQKAIERGEKIVVGVNAFTGETELEVTTSRLVEHPYDPKKREEAEKRQIANLTKVKRERDNGAVEASLKQLKEAARDDSVNLIPPILECVKAYASVGEMSDTLRQVFGEYQAFSAI